MSDTSGEGGMAMLEARGVGKIYETRGVSTLALEGVDLTIQEGEFSALAGPSGSGKTTLLNILGALDAPSSGEVCLDGARFADLSAAPSIASSRRPTTRRTRRAWRSIGTS